MRYWLMRKNDKITLLDFSEDGYMSRFSKDVINEELAPLEYRRNRNEWLKKWWKERSIPLGQGMIDEMLRKSSLIGPNDFLFRNLGLSLTDYYWIRPLDMNLRWEDVNLFDNDFKDNLMVGIDDSLGLRSDKSYDSFTPNGSLQGQLEKSWSIRHGNRIMIKGNPDSYSFDSLNEVFASLLHKKQGYDNYVEYKPLKIKGKPYNYGCYSKCFTDGKHEAISAWALLTSVREQNNQSLYEQFIDICGSYGMDTVKLRQDLEYQIMTDYILSNRDRHMNNISIIRDADTLEFIRMAPIYDSGKSMFVRRYNVSYSDIVDGRINTFKNSEEKMLELVKDKSLVDASKLPGSEELEQIYAKDSNISKERIDEVTNYYKLKVETFKRWQEKNIRTV